MVSPGGSLVHQPQIPLCGLRDLVRCPPLVRRLGGVSSERASRKVIDHNSDKVLITPNTIPSHRLLWWAEQRNQQDALAEALFKAYFTEGRDVGRHDVLVEIASETGLPKAEAGAFLASVVGMKEVSEEINKGLELGIEGVPFLLSTALLP